HSIPQSELGIQVGVVQVQQRDGTAIGARAGKDVVTIERLLFTSDEVPMAQFAIEPLWPFVKEQRVGRQECPHHRSPRTTLLQLERIEVEHGNTSVSADG